MMLSLPVREGGMAIDNPIESASENYKASVASTHMIQVLIMEGGEMSKYDFEAHGKHFETTARDAKIKKMRLHENRAKKLAQCEENNDVPNQSESHANQDIQENLNVGTLDEGVRRAFKRAKEFQTGYFLNAKPLDSIGYHLAKYDWLDNVAVRYNKPLSESIAKCEACPNEEYTISHALTCKKGSNIIHRHNTLKNGLSVIGRKALGKTDFYVHQEPYIVKPGENDCEGKKSTNGLKGDVYLRGVHPIKDETIVDVRVIHPDSGQNANYEKTEELLVNHENLKYKKYKRECDARGWHFVPFIVTTDGAMGPGARRLIENLATKLQKEWEKPKGIVRAWIKMRLSFAIARATSACIRGHRKKILGEKEELEIEIGDGAGVSQLMDMGSMQRPGELT